jgi:hypothetical protein
MHQAGIEVDQLAYDIGANPKSVRRWLAGTEPRGHYRTRVARVLGTTEAELWPELDLRVEGHDERGEILAAYAHANDLDVPDWRALLAQATGHIDLLDLTLTERLSSPGILELLTGKADSGCQVRLLLSAPDSAHLVLADTERGENLSLLDIPPSALAVEQSLAILIPLMGREGFEVRMFIASRFNTILRFDDEMLVTVHLYATPADRAPLLHLKRHSDHGLFEAFAGHFDELWQIATPVSSTRWAGELSD